MSIDLNAKETFLAEKEIEQMIIDREGNEPEQKHFNNSYPPIPGERNK